MKMYKLFCAAVLLAGGIGLAHAQNQPTTNVAPPPNSINKGTTPAKPSGSESRQVARSRGARVVGSGKYCTDRGGVMRCHYRTMAACEKYARHGNLHCVARP